MNYTYHIPIGNELYHIPNDYTEVLEFIGEDLKQKLSSNDYLVDINVHNKSNYGGGYGNSLLINDNEILYTECNGVDFYKFSLNIESQKIKSLKTKLYAQQQVLFIFILKPKLAG